MCRSRPLIVPEILSSGTDADKIANTTTMPNFKLIVIVITAKTCCDMQIETDALI